MLSPNIVETQEDIAAALAQFRALQSFGFSADQTKISPLSPDPDWLSPMRARLADLAAVCATWRIDYPDVIVDYFIPFTNYATTFGAFANTTAKFGDNVDLWTDALTALHKSLLTEQAKSKAAAVSFQDHLANIKNVENLLTDSLNTAWEELADDEDKIVAIAKQVTFLQDRVAQLQGDLTSAEISSGVSYFKTAATISYTVMTAATVEVPYLAVVAEVYTIGKMAYDLIVTDQEIADALQKIADLTVEATEAAQAAAMAKGIIQLINNMTLRVTGLNDRLPALDRMWEVEAGKVAAALDAIQSGATPSEVFDLVSMPVAASGWNTLADLSRKGIQITGTPGKPVFLTNASTQPKISYVQS